MQSFKSIMEVKCRKKLLTTKKLNQLVKKGGRSPARFFLHLCRHIAAEWLIGMKIKGKVVNPDSLSVDKKRKTDELRITVSDNCTLSVVQGKRAKETAVSLDKNNVYIRPKPKLFWTTGAVKVKDRDGNAVKVMSDKTDYHFAAVSGSPYLISVAYTLRIAPLILLAFLAGLCILIPTVLSNQTSPNGYVDRTPLGNYAVGSKRENPIEEQPQEDIPTITFSGYGKFAVSKERPEVEFSNPATNFVDMQFTLIDDATGDTVARTDLVAPGNYVYVNVMNYYKDKKGEFDMTVQIGTFTDDGRQMNGLTEKMLLIIE